MPGGRLKNCRGLLHGGLYPCVRAEGRGGGAARTTAGAVGPKGESNLAPGASTAGIAVAGEGRRGGGPRRSQRRAWPTAKRTSGDAAASAVLAVGHERGAGGGAGGAFCRLCRRAAGACAHSGMLGPPPRPAPTGRPGRMREAECAQRGLRSGPPHARAARRPCPPPPGARRPPGAGRGGSRAPAATYLQIAGPVGRGVASAKKGQAPPPRGRSRRAPRVKDRQARQGAGPLAHPSLPPRGGPRRRARIAAG